MDVCTPGVCFQSGIIFYRGRRSLSPGVLSAHHLMHGKYSCSLEVFLSASGVSLPNGLEDSEVIISIKWHCGQGSYLWTSVKTSYRVFLEGSCSTLLITAELKVAAGLWLISCCLFFP